MTEFAEAPVGRYVLGRNWLYFCAHPELAGYVGWGRIEASDIRAVGPVVRTMHERATRPYCALVDLRRVDSIDASAFDLTAAYAGERAERLRSAIARVAMVGGKGFVGALARGYFDVVPPPYPVEVFVAPRDALLWLGRGRDVDIIQEVDAIVAVGSRAAVVRPLRDLLDERGVRVTLDDAARLLRISSRTLQRRLAEEGSSFGAEVGAARLRMAQRLMLESDAPLGEIAFLAGFASQAHLSTRFRRAVGEAPSVWRARRRTRR